MEIHGIFFRQQNEGKKFYPRTGILALIHYLILNNKDTFKMEILNDITNTVC